MAVQRNNGASLGRGSHFCRAVTTPAAWGVSFEISDLSAESSEQFLEANRVDRLGQMKIKTRIPSRFLIFFSSVSRNRDEQGSVHVGQLTQALCNFVSIHFGKTDIDQRD